MYQQNTNYQGQQYNNYNSNMPHNQQNHTSVYMGNPDPQSPFDNKAIRAAFIAKVYAILFCQLLVATLMIAVCTLHEPSRKYFQSDGSFWVFIAMGVGFVTLLILACVESARRSYPLNFILLGVVTISYGLLAAVLASYYMTYSVICAFGATALATFVILLMAKYSPFDMTTCGCGLCILGLVHLIVSLLLVVILVPMGYGDTASLIIAGAGAFLVSLYIMFDLQLIMGGRSVELSPEEYIIAAVMLYIDILQLFKYILILIGDRR